MFGRAGWHNPGEDPTDPVARRILPALNIHESINNNTCNICNMDETRVYLVITVEKVTNKAERDDASLSQPLVLGLHFLDVKIASNILENGKEDAVKHALPEGS